MSVQRIYQTSKQPQVLQYYLHTGIDVFILEEKASKTLSARDTKEKSGVSQTSYNAP